MGKYVKSTFHEKENRASVILERIHTDVCGPLSIASTAKHKYYVIFVDDFSRKCWIFFMQKKDQTFSKFCEFKALVEKESGKQVKALRSDNGGEYISNEFKDFCNKEGIQRELITHSKMGSRRGRTERLWVQHERCCMIRDYQCICGRKHATLWFIIVVLIEYLA
jgi:transposase InsO family protein